MASIHEALKNIIVGDATINALIAGRVYLFRAPDKPTFPCIVLEEIGNRLEQSRDGSNNLRYMDLLINIYGLEGTYTTTGETLKKSLMNLLTGKQGTFSSVDIHGILFEDDNVEWLDADQVWAVEQSYMVMYIQP